MSDTLESLREAQAELTRLHIDLGRRIEALERGQGGEWIQMQNVRFAKGMAGLDAEIDVELLKVKTL